MKKSKRDILYFGGLALYLIAKDLEISVAFHTVSWVPFFLKLFRFTSYFLIIFVSVTMTDYTRQTLIKYLILMTVFLVISLKAGSVTILFNFMYIFAAKDIPLRKMVYYVVVFQAIITFCIFTSCLIGIIPDWTYMIDGRFRHSMGYGYPNAIPTIFFYSILAICYLLRKRFNFFLFLFLEALNFILFYFTNTRTAFALTAVSLFVFWILKFIRKPLKTTGLTKLIYVHSVYIIAIFSILCCRFYNQANRVEKIIDEFISHRLTMGHNALLKHSLTLFGQKIQWYGFGGVGYTIEKLEGEYNNVDCSYVKILLDSGILMLSLAIIGYMFVSYQELKRGNRYFCVALLFANLYSMIEPRYIETGFNPFVWCLSALLMNRLYLSVKNGLRLKVKNLQTPRIIQYGLLPGKTIER